MKLDLKQIWLCGIIMILMFLMLLYSMNCTRDFYHFKEPVEETSKETEYLLDQLGWYEIISRYFYSLFTTYLQKLQSPFI